MAKFDFDGIKRRMNAAIDDLKKEFAGLRTGRASANLLDPIMVQAYGNSAPLKTVANVSVPEARMRVSDPKLWFAGRDHARHAAP